MSDDLAALQRELARLRRDAEALSEALDREQRAAPRPPRPERRWLAWLWQRRN